MMKAYRNILILLVALLLAAAILALTYDAANGQVVKPDSLQKQVPRLKLNADGYILGETDAKEVPRDVEVTVVFNDADSTATVQLNKYEDYPKYRTAPSDGRSIAIKGIGVRILSYNDKTGVLTLKAYQDTDSAEVTLELVVQ